MAKAPVKKAAKTIAATMIDESKNPALTRFLIDLALESKLRARWELDPEEVLKARTQLTEEQAATLLAAARAAQSVGAAREELYRLLGINQQNP